MPRPRIGKEPLSKAERARRYRRRKGILPKAGKPSAIVKELTELGAARQALGRAVTAVDVELELLRMLSKSHSHRDRLKAELARIDAALGRIRLIIET